MAEKRGGSDRRGQGGRRWDDRGGRGNQRRDDRGDRRRDDRGRGNKRWDDRGDRRRDDRGDRRRDDRGRGNKRWDDRRDRRRDDRGDRPAQEPRFPGQRSTGRPDRSDSPRRDSKPHTREYRSPDPDEPVIPAGVSAEDLHPGARAALSTLGGANQEIVARHLVAAGQLIDFDAEKAYKHAQAAVKRAGRVDVVREAAALTAYATGRYEEALREVRAVRRMRGDQSLRSIEADSERGLGRPEKALEVIEETDTSSLPLDEQAEVVIVAAGARADLDQHELGLLLIEDALDVLPEDTDVDVLSRLQSMRAELLETLGRTEEAEAARAELPAPDEPMEIIDVDALLDADVDHTRTPLRGTEGPLQDKFDGLVLDLDGVCFAGTKPIPHASESITAAKGAGLKLAFATNNASRTAAAVAEKLQGFDIPAEEREVMTSGMNLMYLLEENLELDAKVLVVGADALRDLVKDTGFEVVDEATGPVAAVVQGFSEDVGWKQMTEAVYAIQDGARYYATNLDPTLPSERGFAMGNGALVAAVTRATGARPETAGKPKPEIMERAAQYVGAERPLGVGDRITTDTAAAVAAGMPALHVLTGAETAASVVKARRGERPSYLAIDLQGLEEEHPQPKHHRDGTWTAGNSQPVKIAPWGIPNIGGVDLDPEGDAITISLDTYRALAAAAWEADDEGKTIRIPELVVVPNDDETGYVVELEEPEEPETPEQVQETEETTDPADTEETVEAAPTSEVAEPAVIDAEVVEDPREDPYGTDPKGTDVAQVIVDEPGDLVLAEKEDEDAGE